MAEYILKKTFIQLYSADMGLKFLK